MFIPARSVFSKIGIICGGGGGCGGGREGGRKEFALIVLWYNIHFG